MGHDKKVCCILCLQSDETKTTGALSTKDQVTAHQNCLLFSSGIYCQNSPQFDDLFGFSAEDVLDEVKRGSKLICNRCKKKGATAGCEVKRCKKSYHYPCAVQDGAETVEDVDKGKYGLYCFNHHQKQQEKSSSVNGHASFSTNTQISKNPSEAGPSKVYCVTCEKKEGNISLACTSDSVNLLYCDKHAPASHKRNINGDVPAARLSAYNSDSNSSTGSMKHSSKKRFIDGKHEPPAKRKSEEWNRIITDDSSDSDENQPDTDIAIFAPLESDLDGESQVTRGNTESLSGSPSAGNQHRNESQGEVQDGDETDTESESLLPLVRRSMEAQTVSTAQSSVTLLNMTDDDGCIPELSPVHGPRRHAARPAVSRHSSAGPSPSPNRFNPRSVVSSPPCSSSTISPAPAASASPPSHPEPSIDSASFWKSCNAAGCTQAIFTDFINVIYEISSRIQSGQAGQEDYDLALRVMEASGKLAELVTKQQKALERKQMELHEAAASMMKVASALRK